jgi:hypothetical protein
MPMRRESGVLPTDVSARKTPMSKVFKTGSSE